MDEHLKLVWISCPCSVCWKFFAGFFCLNDSQQTSHYGPKPVFVAHIHHFLQELLHLFYYLLIFANHSSFNTLHHGCLIDIKCFQALNTSTTTPSFFNAVLWRSRNSFSLLFTRNSSLMLQHKDLILNTSTVSSVFSPWIFSQNLGRFQQQTERFLHLLAFCLSAGRVLTKFSVADWISPKRPPGQSIQVCQTPYCTLWQL